MQLTVTAQTPDGRKYPLENPISMEYDGELFTPCDSLTALFPVQWEGIDFCRITARLDGGNLFEGIVDRQEVEKSAAGQLLRLTCRSTTALLLDNEVKPYIYFQLTSKQLFDRFAAPFGVKGTRFPYEAKQNFMQVKKGASYWTVIEDFCRFTYRKLPYLERDGYLTLTPLHSVRRLIGNRTTYAAGWTKLNLRRKNDAVISRLYMKTATETYGYYYGFVVNNPEADRRGIRRERFYHPEDQISVYAQAAARKKITDGNRDSFTAEVVLPGLYDWTPGDRASLPEELPGRELFIRGVRLNIGESGLTTRLILQEVTDDVA